jgi:hypothetical protein
MDGVVLVGNVAAAPGTRVLAHARLPVIPARPTPAGVTPVSVAQIPKTVPAPVASPALDRAYPPAPPALEESGDLISHAETEPAEHEQHDTGDGAHDDGTGPVVLEREGETALVPPWARDGAFNPAPLTAPSGAKTMSFWVAIIAAAIVAGGLITWATTAMLSRGTDANTTTDSARTAAHGAAAAAARISTDSAAAAAVAAGDSAAYSVVLADVSSATGANSELDLETERGFPAVTYAPYVRADGRLSYTILSGASRDSTGADSLLQAVRAKHYKNAQAAHVVRLPYAVRIQGGVSTDQASMFVHAYVSKGLPVYPLVQSDGSATLYAGAFRTAEQAQPLLTSFRANGDQPTVTLRTGRPF